MIADEDIYTGDGTLRAEKDTVVETLTTGEDGTAKSGSLYLGRYRLEERQAPSGCVLNPQPEYVELTYAGETVEVIEKRIHTVSLDGGSAAGGGDNRDNYFVEAGDRKSVV